MIVANKETDGQLIGDGEQHALLAEAGSEGVQHRFVREGHEDAAVGDRNIDAGGFDGARRDFDVHISRTFNRGDRAHVLFLNSA